MSVNSYKLSFYTTSVKVQSTINKSHHSRMSF